MFPLSVRLGGLSPEDKAAAEEARKRKEEEARKAAAAAEAGKVTRPVSYQDKPITNPAYEASVSAREDTQRRVAEEDRRYSETVLAAEKQLGALRGGAGKGKTWVVTDPETGEQRELRGGDIDRLQADLDRYKSEYINWKASTYQRLGAYAERMRTLSDRYVSTGTYGQPTLREASTPGLLRYKAEPQQQSGGPVETVRGVWSSQWPTPPSQELSVNDYSTPADTRPVYTAGREPTSGEQLLGVARVPSVVVGAAGEGLGLIRERLPKTEGAQTLNQYTALLEGGVLGFAAVIDPSTYLAIPGIASEGVKYLKEKNWLEVQSDVGRTLGEYKESRLADPSLIWGDIGYQLGASLGFKAVLGVSKSAGSAIGKAASVLPGDGIGSKGLAVIGGDSPVPFKQAYQLVMQKGSGVPLDTLGPKGLAIISGEAGAPLRQLLQVVSQKARIPGDVAGARGLAVFSGYAGMSTPFKQSLEVILSKADIKNIIGEPLVGRGLAAIGDAPVMLPVKQTLEVISQKGGLTPDILGGKGLANISGSGSSISLKALTRFMRMPSAVEPYSRVPYTPKTTAGDISGFLKIKADESAQMEAEKLEAFMKATFTERPSPVKGAPDTPASTLIQIGERQRGSIWGGLGAVDVFPFVVVSYPPDVKMSGPKAEVQLIDVQKQRLSIKQSLSLGSGLNILDAQVPELKLGEAAKLEVDLGFKQTSTPKPTEVQKPRADIILDVFETQTTRQDQPQRQVPMVPITTVTERTQKPLLNIFGRQGRSSTETPSILGARRYRYRTIESEDIIGTGGGGGVNVFGSKKRRKEVNVF